MKPVRTNRGLIKYILLTFITCGIYGLWYISQWAKDINTICAADGRHTRGLIGLLLFSLITCGIYPIIYYYNFCERLKSNCVQNGVHSSVSGGKYILFCLLSSITAGITGLIIIHDMMATTNRLAADYNSKLTSTT